MKIVDNRTSKIEKFGNLKDGTIFEYDIFEYDEAIWMKFYKDGKPYAIGLICGYIAEIPTGDFVNIVNAHLVIED